MPLNIKQSVTESGSVRKALRRRITEDSLKELSERQIDQKLTDYITTKDQQIDLNLIAGIPIYSSNWANFIKDEKFLVSSLNGRINDLDESVVNYTQETDGALKDIQNEALVMDSILTEEEIKKHKRFTTVHYNAFTRAIDSQLDIKNDSWKVDYKTGLNFLPENKANIIPNTGLTLPLRS